MKCTFATLTSFADEVTAHNDYQRRNDEAAIGRVTTNRTMKLPTVREKALR
jgi:hypothetical protein